METAAGVRQRRRRRVLDEDRKRAPRACTRCKARKSKCIETPHGVCQRCQQQSLPCHFERTRSPPATIDPDILSDGQTSPIATFETDGPTAPSHGFMWPRFLSKLRETFSLVPSSRPESESRVNPQYKPPTHHLQPEQARRLQKAVDAFPPRPIADFLLSVCNEHGTDAFFYFDQAQMIKDIENFYTSEDSHLRQDVGFVCLAHAAFALGSQWATLVRPQSSHPNPLDNDGDPGRIFYHQARSLIPEIIELNVIRAVQASYLIGVYLLPASAIGSSYIYLGLALRKALALDLHLKSEDIVADATEREIRCRLWWAIYSLERQDNGPFTLNRPRSIDASAITADLPTTSPSLDDRQVFNNIDHQIANAQLTKIIDLVEEPIASQSLLLRIDRELKSWKQALPPSLRLQNIDPKSSSYRAAFHLYLNYYFTWISMGKVSVVAIVRAHLRKHLAQDNQPIELSEHAHYLSQTCIKAARKILHLLEDVRRTGNLTRFSFTDFQGCSIATTVILLAGILERDASYERLVVFGLDSLRKMAEGNATATAGVGFVEALQSIADEAVEKMNQTETLPPATNFGSRESDYNTWAQWLAQQSGQVDESVDSLHQRTFEAEEPIQTHGSALSPESSTAFTRWDGATALQQLSEPAYTATMLSVQDQTTPTPLSHFDGSYSSIQFNQDPTFLMGLTGIDMLGFDFQP
ncbi:hypothetical protein BU24DRAFT_483775 [Aaosphaeria arxii CBS 175.79]|uniref:Zn(2)-C6 fungal-type domain-containing protein n=1 Tax=Aaosphaeria arxii CBS 175.79 TaxID=1450172 RepID=A0A6A5XM68_9PLEO|nr:uncharacterized protein BU24DRAFT_483775 [Aaosphaeria arxii CBS 175.79]KAF2013937.1 hypothetical protein BU24DRAFT_483775 [Aaosphaeria arxii CBS 175.79]